MGREESVKAQDYVGRCMAKRVENYDTRDWIRVNRDGGLRIEQVARRALSE